MGFLRALFGPSKEEIWSQVASQIKGKYIKSGFFGTDKLVYVHGEWELVLDTYTESSSHGKNSSSTTYTRMRAPFLNKDNLNFHIYREGFFSPLGKALGFQDIEVGDPDFDKEFIIKGNNAAKISQVLADERIKKLLQWQPRVSVKLRSDKSLFFKKYPEGVNELYFSCVGVMKTQEDLRNLFELFCLILDRLVKIDSAYEDDPGVVLT
ncbi:MAG: hypothetical protein NE327_21705 [Lentisphaeraceae bacterium]|nr:hypothetical protein [Lentisphaeraceae bacterium]